MKEKQEETLAIKIELINKKLDIVINQQQKLEEKLNKNNKTLMSKISKLQEYNEINDMRFKILNQDINNIIKVIIKMNQKLY